MNKERLPARARTGVNLQRALRAVWAAPLLVGSVAVGQELPDSGAGVQEVIVTAQRREERLQDVPISLTALSADALETRNLNGIGRIDTLVPNLKFNQGTYSGSTTISIRGSVEINPVPYIDPTVGIYVNGVYVGKALGNLFDLPDLERVEVLRGPQGTLYGRNTFAGAINLVSAKPTGEFDGSLKVGIGNYDAQRARFSLDLPRVGDFSVKLSGLVDQHGGYVDVRNNPFDNVSRALPRAVDEFEQVDKKAARVAVRFDPTDTFAVDYAFDYSTIDATPRGTRLTQVAELPLAGAIFDPASPAYAGGLVGDTYLGFPADLYLQPKYSDYTYANGSVNNAPPTEQARITGHALTAEWQVGELAIKSISALRDVDFANKFDLDGTPLPLAAARLNNDFQQFSQELQAVGTAGSLNYTLGLYYYRERGEVENMQQFFGNASTTQLHYKFGADAYAAYGQADYHLSDAWTLTGGLRYSSERKTMNAELGSLAEATQVFTPIYGNTKDAATNDALTPTAILKYDINSDANVYLKYAKGFKSGGFNIGTSAAFAVTRFDPQFVDSYELGTKLRFLNGDLSVNAAVFMNKLKDLQVTVFKNNGILTASVVDNAAKATVKGAELELQYMPVDWLRLTASAGYTDAEYDSYLDNGVDVSKTKVFPVAPEFTGNLGADVRIAQGTWGALHGMVDYSHSDDYYVQAFDVRPLSATVRQSAQTTRAEALDLLNVALRLADVPAGDATMELTLWARNALDTHRRTGGVDFGPQFGNLITGYYNEPRTYGADVSFKF